MTNESILFVCKGNSGRSQMAEAFFNKYSGSKMATSAGTNPDQMIHPWTVQLMKEVGLDVSLQKPKTLTGKAMKKANRIILMDSDLLKFIPSEYLPKTEVWDVGKLLGKPIERVREIRDAIERKVEQLIFRMEMNTD